MSNRDIFITRREDEVYDIYYFFYRGRLESSRFTQLRSNRHVNTNPLTDAVVVGIVSDAAADVQRTVGVQLHDHRTVLEPFGHIELSRELTCRRPPAGRLFVPRFHDDLAREQRHYDVIWCEVATDVDGHL